MFSNSMLTTESYATTFHGCLNSKYYVTEAVCFICGTVFNTARTFCVHFACCLIMGSLQVLQIARRFEYDYVQYGFMYLWALQWTSDFTTVHWMMGLSQVPMTLHWNNLFILSDFFRDAHLYVGMSYVLYYHCWWYCRRWRMSKCQPHVHSWTAVTNSSSCKVFFLNPLTINAECSVMYITYPMDQEVG